MCIVLHFCFLLHFNMCIGLHFCFLLHFNMSNFIKSNTCYFSFSRILINIW